MTEPDNKPILFLGGGTMSGVFTMGVLKSLHEAGIRDEFGIIYGNSGGSINGAMFATGQIEEAVRGYTKDMTAGFINLKHIPKAIWQTLRWNNFVKSGKKPVHVLDIDFLFDFIEKNNVIDLEALKKYSHPIYTALFNIDTGEVDYCDIREDPLTVLKAATAAAPYYSGHVVYKGKRYVDGAIKVPISLEHILKQHPNRKIVLILNQYWKWGAWKYIRTHIEGFFAGAMYGLPLQEAFINMELSADTAINEAKRLDNCLVITPSRKSKAISQTTRPNLLVDTLKIGEEEAGKVIEFIKS